MLLQSEIAAISVKPRAELGNRTSTNPLLSASGWHFLLSKTGFIRQSGGCLTVVVEVKGEPLVITILGSTGTKERWRDLAEIRRHLGDTGFYVPVKVTAVREKRR
jgi:D-alanyl-D-alanine carboxypeptidase